MLEPVSYYLALKLQHVLPQFASAQNVTYKYVAKFAAMARCGKTCTISAQSHMKRALALIILIFLGSCGLTPERACLQEAPRMVLLQAQSEALNDAAFVDEEWLNQRWWTLFGDEQLNAFIVQALACHPSMRAAEARIAAADAIRLKQGAALFPSLEFEFDITRVHFSKNGLLGLIKEADPAFPLTFTQKTTGLICRYELDLWKKHTNEIVAALDEERAVAIEAFAARLTLALAVAEWYFQHQIYHDRLHIAEALLRNREDIASIIALKNKNNLENKLQLNIADSSTNDARRYRSTVMQEYAESNYALQALLADQFLTPIEPIKIQDRLAQPFPLPHSLPLDLLAHRPDLWAQRWRVEAASCQVSVARARFYPNVNLLAALGFQALVPNPLFVRDSLAGLLFGPAIHLPLFEGGALMAELDLGKQDYYLKVAKYDELVLDAVKETLQAITAVRTTSERYDLALEIEALAKNSLELVRLKGPHLRSRLELLTYENQLLQARDNTLQALFAALHARLILIRALGGGL
jgi:NodT family efflux transporter outer membrane factor (OMF) lipoprotein